MDAIETPISADARVRRELVRLREDLGDAVAQGELVQQSVDLLLHPPAARREDQPRLGHLLHDPRERPHEHVEVRVRPVVAEREHDERVLRPPEPRAQPGIAVLGAERPQVDVPDDPVHLLARRAEPDRLLRVRERRHDELVSRRDRHPHALPAAPPLAPVGVDVRVPGGHDERVDVGPRAPPAVRQEVVRMHEVDVEPLRQTANGGAEAEPAQPLHPRDPRQVADVVHGQPVQLFPPLRDPVRDDVHLVAALGEPPGPAQEDDRLSIADTQEAKGSVGHGAELYPWPRAHAATERSATVVETRGGRHALTATWDARDSRLPLAGKPRVREDRGVLGDFVP